MNSTPFVFEDWMRTRLAAVDAFLKGWIADRLPETPAILKEAMLYSLMAGGKRVRPLLVYATSDAVVGKWQVVTAGAAAVECMHTYSLIHDDLPAMDDDDLRRGKPTCHKVYGEALAILAGDALQALAFSIVADDYSDLKVVSAVKLLASGAGADGMVGGQTYDLIADGRIEPKRGDRDREELRFLEKIHRRKTGALFLASVRLGCDLAGPDLYHRDGVDDKRREALDRYAEAFGMAFQITDDLLDVQGDAETVGKKTGKDAGRGKLTYPGLLGVEAAQVEAEKHFQNGLSALEMFGPQGEPLRNLMRALRNRKK